jgi:hypothetical protein
MSAATSAAQPGTSQQAVVEAALVLLERMGLSPADLTAAPQNRPAVPTFAEYVPVVSAAVTAGTRRAYGSYWNRIVEHWGGRRLDEPTPSEIRQLMIYVKTHVVRRRNARGGRSAEEHLVAALRCLYQRAVDDGLIKEADNPARKVAKPRRLPSTRRAVPDTRLAEINEAAATTGDDPELDTLLLRLHTETACRRGGALALRPADLDPDQCLILLREKGETVRWQPVSPTLMGRLVQHGQQRHAPPDGHLLRYASGHPITFCRLRTLARSPACDIQRSRRPGRITDRNPARRDPLTIACQCRLVGTGRLFRPGMTAEDGNTLSAVQAHKEWPRQLENRPLRGRLCPDGIG